MAKAALAPKAPEERRRRILEATVTVIRERGFVGTRVSDIAEEAGTSQGLVLYHFGSLAGALTEALTFLEDEFYADLVRDLAAVESPVDGLRHLVDLAAGHGPAVGDWKLWLELWVRALHDPDAARTRESLDDKWRASLRDVIAEGVASGDFKPRDPDGSAVRLACLMDGLAVQLALSDPDITPDLFRHHWLTAAAEELGIKRDELFGDHGSATRS